MRASVRWHSTPHCMHACRDMTSMSSMSLLQRLHGHAGPVVCAAAASDGQSVLSGDEAGMLCSFDSSTLQLKFQAQLGSTDDDSVTSVCCASEPYVLYASVGTSVHNLDVRSGTAPVATFQGVCKDEINQVAVDMKAKHLATADDAGDVKVFDLTARKLFKCMKGAHDSMATCVSFRPHRPWELISGGMDSTIARWDFSKGKCLSRWQMSQPTGHEERQVFNPPFVHALVVPGVASSVRPWCQLVAAARGDGTVMVFDADQPPSTTASLLQQHTDTGRTVPSGDLSADSTSTSAGSTRATGSSTRGGRLGVSGRAGSSKHVSALQQEPGKNTIQQKQGGVEGRGWVGPVAWGTEHGGHKQPASCVTYSWAGCTADIGNVGPPWLVSGSEDRQLIVWRLQQREGGEGPRGEEEVEGGIKHVQSSNERHVQSSNEMQAAESKPVDVQPLSNGQVGGASRAGGSELPNSGKGHVGLAVRHLRKINCIDAGRQPSQQLLFVGDTSRLLTVYQLPQLT